MTLRDRALVRICHELMNTKRTEAEIIDGVVRDTFYKRAEVSILYVEALQRIVNFLRNTEDGSHGRRKTQVKRRAGGLGAKRVRKKAGS